MSEVIADNPVLAAMLAYWRGKRGARSMPRRSDIDPTEIPQLLPYLQIVDLVAGRFRYRLSGTAIVEAYGREVTGKFMDEIIPAHRRAVAEHHYRLVYETHRPLFVRNKFTTTKAIDIGASRVILPLSEDGVTVSMLIMAQTFEYGAKPPVQIDKDSMLAPYSGQIEFIEEEPAR